MPQGLCWEHKKSLHHPWRRHKIWDRFFLPVSYKLEKAPIMNTLRISIVPRAGIEPARTFVHWCLRPTRLPIPPSGLIVLGAKIQ